MQQEVDARATREQVGSEDESGVYLGKRREAVAQRAVAYSTCT